jgi:protein subunit release factor B
MAKFGVRPEKEDRLFERMKELGIRKEDIKETFIRSGGPGGQGVNKVSTCVRLKHIPTGIVVKSQEGRSQGLNRFFARRLLVSKIENAQLGKESPDGEIRKKIRKQKQRSSRRTKKKLSEVK